METIVITTNDQLYVNNKWYFDVIDINDNIIQVRIQYKENPNINNFLYKNINLDKTIFTKVEEYKTFIKCEVDENKLKQIIGNLISRIKVEIDYSFVFEDVGVATSANSAGMGAVSMPGVNSTPGMTGSAGSADISTVLGPSVKYNDEIGVAFNKNDTKKKKRKKLIIKTPVIKLENLNTIQDENQLRTKILDIIDYPIDNNYDKLFINNIKEKKSFLMNSSTEVIKQYINDLISLNKSLIKNCSEWFINQIEKIKDL